MFKEKNTKNIFKEIKLEESIKNKSPIQLKALLEKSVEIRNFEIAKKILDLEFLIINKEEYSQNIMSIARNGDLKMLELFLNHKKFNIITEEEYIEELEYLIMVKWADKIHMDVYKALLNNKKFDVFKKENSYKILSEAARIGFIDLVKYWLENEKFIELNFDDSKQIFLEVLEYKHFNTFEYLIQNEKFKKFINNEKGLVFSSKEMDIINNYIFFHKDNLDAYYKDNEGFKNNKDDAKYFNYAFYDSLESECGDEVFDYFIKTEKIKNFDISAYEKAILLSADYNIEGAFEKLLSIRTITISPEFHKKICSKELNDEDKQFYQKLKKDPLYPLKLLKKQINQLLNEAIPEIKEFGEKEMEKESYLEIIEDRIKEFLETNKKNQNYAKLYQKTYQELTQVIEVLKIRIKKVQDSVENKYDDLYINSKLDQYIETLIYKAKNNFFKVKSQKKKNFILSLEKLSLEDRRKRFNENFKEEYNSCFDSAKYKLNKLKDLTFRKKISRKKPQNVKFLFEGDLNVKDFVFKSGILSQDKKFQRIVEKKLYLPRDCVREIKKFQTGIEKNEFIKNLRIFEVRRKELNKVKYLGNKQKVEKKTCIDKVEF